MVPSTRPCRKRDRGYLQGQLKLPSRFLAPLSAIAMCNKEIMHLGEEGERASSELLYYETFSIRLDGPSGCLGLRPTRANESLASEI